VGHEIDAGLLGGIVKACENIPVSLQLLSKLGNMTLKHYDALK
jgi:hypothetical protein